MGCPFRLSNRTVSESTFGWNPARCKQALAFGTFSTIKRLLANLFCWNGSCRNAIPALNRAISAFMMCSPSATRRLNDSRSAVSNACGCSAASASSPSSARIFFNSSSVTCRQPESSSCSSKLGTAEVRAKRPTWGSSITISKSFAPELRRNRTDSNVIPFTFRSSWRTSARWGLFIRPPELRTTFWANQRCLALLNESLAGNFNDDAFRLQKIQLAPDLIGHKLANGAVRQPHKCCLQNRTDAKRTDHPLEGILGPCKASLFLDEVLQADFFISAVVGVHAFTCIAVIPS